MSTAAAGVWIAAILGFSAPLTAAVVAIGIKARPTTAPSAIGDCELGHATSARVDVLEAGAGRINERLRESDERFKEISRKLESLHCSSAIIEGQLAVLVKHNGGMSSSS
ncbi:hypothetical protein [uncultured Mediterranean phage uvDeep-CGR2-KM19-C37]|nr:hypothetical protein [uncultured Mediterranean phage uvDeep-CGR2-KM19-C37]